LPEKYKIVRSQTHTHTHTHARASEKDENIIYVCLLNFSAATG